jgi:hypothetical protein
MVAEPEPLIRRPCRRLLGTPPTAAEAVIPDVPIRTAGHVHAEDAAVDTEPRRVVLTDDNWADHFPFDYAESLVRGMTIGTAGRHPDYSPGSPGRAAGRGKPGTR